MEYNEKKAIEIIKKFNLSSGTLRTWKMRNKIPNRYTSSIKRVHLQEVANKEPLLQTNIDTAVKKYGDKLRHLLDNRTFKGDQKKGYYNTCLLSLCRECETFKETGKLSEFKKQRKHFAPTQNAKGEQGYKILNKFFPAGEEENIYQIDGSFAIRIVNTFGVKESRTGETIHHERVNKESNYTLTITEIDENKRFELSLYSDLIHFGEAYKQSLIYTSKAI